MTNSAPLAIRIPPAIAGGRLRNLADVLWLDFKRDEDRRALVVIDPSLRDAELSNLLIIDGKGTPLSLPSGHHDRWSREERASIFAAARDRMPNTAEAEAVLDLCLPRPEESLVEGAVELWQQLLAGSALEVVASADCPSQTKWLDCDSRPELLWLSPRHERALVELGVDLSVALQGKQALEDVLGSKQRSEVPAFVGQLHKQLDRDLEQLKGLIHSEFPGMLGAWNRYRRAARRAIKQLERSTDRSTRNRKGIRGSRLHSLAHSIRPYGQSQEAGLGLVCAAACFRMPLDDLVEHSKAFHGATPQSLVVVNIGAGNSTICSLS